jgi:phytoene synthase
MNPQLPHAYRTCEALTREHSRTFYLSARLVPAHKRAGIMALYAFCRLTDNLVDQAALGAATHHLSRALDRWAALNLLTPSNAKQAAPPTAPASSVGDSSTGLPTSDRGQTSAAPPTTVQVAAAWADTRSRYSIPSRLAATLIEGVRMDLTINRYDTWNDLWLYNYRVASTVGLMSMYITGAETSAAAPYAVQLGIALQLTNILRDVGEDARAGRIYLPQEDMLRFGYTDEMLLSGVVNKQFVRLMSFEIERARTLYEAAWPGIALLSPDSRFAVQAAATLYRRILDCIEAAGYDVFTRRAHVSTADKVRALPSIWFHSKQPHGPFPLSTDNRQLTTDN